MMENGPFVDELPIKVVMFHIHDIHASFPQGVSTSRKLHQNQGTPRIHLFV